MLYVRKLTPAPLDAVRALRAKVLLERARRVPLRLASPASRAPRQRLPREHRALAILSPVVTSEGTVLMQHVVAGNEPCHRVGADGPAHRPGGAGAAHRARERRVRGWSGAAELEQRLPDLELKVRALHGELERWRGPRASRAAGRAPDASRNRRRGVLVAPQARLRPAGGERGHAGALGPWLDEGEMAQAARGAREQRAPER